MQSHCVSTKPVRDQTLNKVIGSFSESELMPEVFSSGQL